MSIISHTYLLDRARAFLGQSVVGQVDFKDADLLGCLDKVTLPTFSVYMPFYHDVLVDTEKDRAFRDRIGVYRIPAQGGMQLLGVNQIRDRNLSLDYVGTPYDPRNFNDLTDRQFATDYLSAMDVTMTFKFKAPNILEVFPKVYDLKNFLVECKFVHPTTLRTIPPGAIETLKELFLADVCADLLGVREYFQNLQTVFGEIQMNLDRIRAQSEKRESIIEQLNLKQLKTGNAMRVFIG